jgi:hypothetical protein
LLWCGVLNNRIPATHIGTIHPKTKRVKVVDSGTIPMKTNVVVRKFGASQKMSPGQQWLVGFSWDNFCETTCKPIMTMRWITSNF